MPNFLRVLLTPSCWIRNYRTSPHLSRFIQDHLRAGEQPEVLNGFHAKLGGKVLWVRNYPYGYGSEAAFATRGPIPDRKTVFMLADAVDRARFA